MRVGIFYYSQESNGEDCQELRLPKGGVVYVRVEEVELAGEDDSPLSDALGLADLRPGESVMNTHELPDPAEIERCPNCDAVMNETNRLRRVHGLRGRAS